MLAQLLVKQDGILGLYAPTHHVKAARTPYMTLASLLSRLSNQLIKNK